MPLDVITTKYGAVSGTEHNGITVFKGIPYAAPPVGELRFKPPVEPARWDGIRICDTYAPAAIQKMPLGEDGFEPYNSDFYWDGAPDASEDCLYLNILTPAVTGDEKLPVYIWFHGGGLDHGYSYEVEFDGTELTKKGIVVVSVAQRLNVFGYLALPQLSAEQGGVSGNYGFMDQMMAFNWVVENISAFGGDPDNITLGGQSGGTTKTSPMLAMDEVKGHVKGIISESGLKWQMEFPTLQEGEQQGIAYLKAAGLDPDISPDELRKLDAWELYKYAKALPSMIYMDGKLFDTTKVSEMWKNVEGVNFLCGCNLGETPPQANVDRKLYKPFTTKEEFYANYSNVLGDLYDKYDFESLVPVTDENAWITARRLASLGLTFPSRANMSRSVMLCRIFGMHRAKHAAGCKVFNYLWGHVLPSRPEDVGTARDPERWLAYHSSEMWYAYASFSEGVPPVRPWRDSDYKAAEIANTYWANFIKTGDPNGENLPTWPAASGNYGWMEVTNDGFTGHEGLDSKLDKLVHEFALSAYNMNAEDLL